MKLLFLTIFSLSFVITSLSAYTLKEKVRQDSFLSNGFTNFIQFGTEIYLVAVGISKIEDESIQANINSIKEAKILAKTKLTKFIHNVTITSKQNLIIHSSTINSNKNCTYTYKDEYIELIKEKNSGILKNIVDIGKWKDKNEYFYALGVKVTK